jgi:hypothetical protein
MDVYVAYFSVVANVGLTEQYITFVGCMYRLMEWNETQI